MKLKKFRLPYFVGSSNGQTDVISKGRDHLYWQLGKPIDVDAYLSTTETDHVPYLDLKSAMAMNWLVAGWNVDLAVSLSITVHNSDDSTNSIITANWETNESWFTPSVPGAANYVPFTSGPGTPNPDRERALIKAFRGNTGGPGCKKFWDAGFKWFNPGLMNVGLSADNFDASAGFSSIFYAFKHTGGVDTTIWNGPPTPGTVGLGCLDKLKFINHSDIGDGDPGLVIFDGAVKKFFLFPQIQASGIIQPLPATGSAATQFSILGPVGVPDTTTNYFAGHLRKGFAVSITVDPVIAPSFIVPAQGFIDSDIYPGGGTSSGWSNSTTAAFSVTLTANAFLPYATSKGDPVYDAKTGAILNDPFS